jgi:hypothetical protein
MAVVFLIVLVFLLWVQNTFAVCPLCTLAVGGGVGVSRWLGIDDVILGIWIGGLTVSLIFWTKEWLDKKNIHFKGKNLLNIIFYYLLVLGSLYLTGILKENIIYSFWLSKVLLGVILGSFVFWVGAKWHYYLKEKNGGKVYFPFQKVVLPVAPLIILSLIFYFLSL